jgi:L-aminopeptidase/D-esterase-like protein
MANLKEIKITDIKNIRIGQTENTDAATGCTVFISEKGMRAGLDVRGGGPASRESELMKPVASAEEIHAVVLGGGSAFGLDAAGGVQQYLEEKGIGFDVGVTKVPLVCQSDIFDLTVADMSVRPDHKMGYEAAKAAFESPNFLNGNYGAGTGATVGKYCGMETCMKTGIGSYAIRLGELEIGAVVVLNALGDIFDYKTGKKIAGLLNEEKNGFRDTVELMKKNTEVVENRFTGNTTVGIVMTNAYFDKPALCKIAGMTHNGYARCINPVHTSADGDSIYAVSLGDVKADQDVVGTLAAEVMSEAIKSAVYSAETAYGYISAASLNS